MTNNEQVAAITNMHDASGLAADWYEFDEDMMSSDIRPLFNSACMNALDMMDGGATEQECMAALASVVNAVIPNTIVLDIHA